MPFKAIDAVNIKQDILVVLPKYIGDAINCLASVILLRTLYPNQKIILLCRPPLAEILTREESCNCEILVDRRFDKQDKSSFFQQVRTVKNANCSLAVIFRSSFTDALLCKLAGIKVNVGYAKNGCSLLLSHAVKFNKSHHYLYRYCRLVNDTHGNPFTSIPIVKLRKEPSQYIQISEKKQIGVYFGGKNKGTRHYPSLLACEALNLITKEHNVHYYLLGDSFECAENAMLAELLDKKNTSYSNLTGKISLIELLDVIANLDVLISIDSGPMHLAAATGTPFVAVVGLGTSPWSLVDPKVDNKIALVANSRELDDNKIIESITPIKIAQAVDKLIPTSLD